MQDKSVKEKIEFLALTGFAQWVGLWTFAFLIIAAFSGVV